MNTLGRHLVAELYDCSPTALDDVDTVRSAMRAAANAVGATVVGELFHRYAPQGVTGTLLIAESHLSVHTWPEAGYAAIDVFTCGGLDPNPAVQGLCADLGAASYRVQEIRRGTEADLQTTLAPEDVLVASKLGAARRT